MPKRILVVVESINVEDSSGSKANVALIRNLKKIGYDLRVYHYTRQRIDLKGIPCFEIEEDRRSALFYLSRLERYIRTYLRIKLNRPLEKAFGFSFTLLNDRNSIRKGLKNCHNWDPDLVLTLSKGGSFRPHHALLELPVFHKKWLAYIHDPYPMHFYPPPYPWYEPGFVQKEKFMRQVATKAAFTAFPSQLLMEWMGDHEKYFREKGVVIPHQLEDMPEVDVELPSFFREEKFNVVHAGNLIQGRDPNGVILGFKRFIEKNPEAGNHVNLLFLGGENYYSRELLEYEEEIPQFYFSREKLTFSTAQNIQKNSAVNIILEAKSTISPFLPGKFPHCVRANKTILLSGPPRSESRRLLGKDYEYWSEIDDVEKISNLLGGLYKKWTYNPELLQLERKDLERYLSTTHLAEVMEHIFDLQDRRGN